MTTLGKAVADISIPTWKELKPASETARKRGVQHNTMMKKTMMRTTRNEKAKVEVERRERTEERSGGADHDIGKVGGKEEA